MLGYLLRLVLLLGTSAKRSRDRVGDPKVSGPLVGEARLLLAAVGPMVPHFVT